MGGYQEDAQVGVFGQGHHQLFGHKDGVSQESGHQEGGED